VVNQGGRRTPCGDWPWLVEWRLEVKQGLTHGRQAGGSWVLFALGQAHACRRDARTTIGYTRVILGVIRVPGNANVAARSAPPILVQVAKLGLG
jgi:hypothetical protein